MTAVAAITAAAAARRFGRNCGHHSESSSSKIWLQLRPSQRQLEDVNVSVEKPEERERKDMRAGEEERRGEQRGRSGGREGRKREALGVGRLGQQLKVGRRWL